MHTVRASANPRCLTVGWRAVSRRVAGRDTASTRQSALVAGVNYVKAPPAGQELFGSIRPVKVGEPRQNLDTRATDVVVEDIRKAQETFILDRHGFQLEQFLVPDIDFDNEDEVSRRDLAQSQIFEVADVSDDILATRRISVCR